MLVRYMISQDSNQCSWSLYRCNAKILMYMSDYCISPFGGSTDIFLLKAVMSRDTLPMRSLLS
jgi:hypothetical protein